MFAALIVTFIIVFVVFNGYRSTCKPQNYPPGPPWYPFMGCSGLVRKLTQKHGSQIKGLRELKDQYSTQVLGLKLARQLVVVVYGNDNIRHAFINKEFEGRPDTFFSRLRCLGKRMGITFTDGPVWQEQRRFTLKNLKNVGFGKTAMEKEIQTELSIVVEKIKTHNGKPINPINIFASAVMNVLWKYVAGERISEKRLDKLLNLFNKRSKAFTMAGSVLDELPWVRFIFPELTGYTLIADLNSQISEIIEETIRKHKDGSIEENDFIHSYLQEMKIDKNYTEEQLKIVCLDLLIAGSQTTSNVISFAILTILKNKLIQDKIYEELERVIGDEVPSWADNSRLVYTNAFLLEVHRMYTIVPFAGPRRVLEQTVVDGYTIPEGATVMLATGDLSIDPQLWEDPQEFKPERFIDERGMLKDVEHLYPFGLGRRRCPGDTLAKSFIFITFVGILQKFKICSNKCVLPSLDYTVGLIASPNPFLAEFILRK